PASGFDSLPHKRSGRAFGWHYPGKNQHASQAFDYCRWASKLLEPYPFLQNVILSRGEKRHVQAESRSRCKTTSWCVRCGSTRASFRATDDEAISPWLRDE